MSRHGLDKLFKELPHPDKVGSTEYRAVYEMLEDCNDLEDAGAICDELLDVAAGMVKRIRAIQDAEES